MKLEFDLNEDPGRGNLNLRAYFAAVLGPKRIAHAVRRVVVVPSGRGVLLARNQVGGIGPQCMYVNCEVPERVVDGNTVNAAAFRFAGDEALGDNSAYRILQPIAGDLGSYHEVLLPGEQLYAQFAPGTGALTTLTEFSLVVSTVSF